MTIEQTSPDNSTLSRFRTGLTKTGTFEKLFKSINSQLEKENIIVRKGAVVDAGVIDTPLRSKGKSKLKVTEDRSDEEVEVSKDYADSVDKDGSCLTKRGKLHFGYKKHHVTDEEGLVLGVVTTTASKNVISNLEEVLDTADLPEGIPLKAEKGCQSKKNEDLLKRKS